MESLVGNLWLERCVRNLGCCVEEVPDSEVPLQEL